MNKCEKLLHRLAYFCIIIFVLTLSSNGKPRIEGPEEIISNLGQNVSIECWGNRSITWYKYVNKTSKPKIINEESHTDHVGLEVPEYIDWPDPHENSTEAHLAILHIENAKIEDSGLYVCTYESGDLKSIMKRVKKNKSSYFDSVQLTVKIMKPLIDAGRSVTLNATDNLNLTCSGDRPVTWVLTNNHTWGIQHTESELENRTIYLSVLQIENVNFTDVGYFVCKYSDVEKNVYEDFNDFVRDDQMNFAATYLFVRDVNHLIVQQDTTEFTARLSTKVIIPCKPTFPEVKISLVALDGSMNEKKEIHYPHSIHTGFLLIEEIASTTNLICTARFLERVENVSLTVTYYNPILSSVNLTVENAWQMNSIERRLHTYDVVEGDVLMINCSTQYKKNIARIMWQTPASANEIKRHLLRSRDYEDKTVETRIISKVSRKKDSGIYSCYVTNDHVNSSSFGFALNVFSYRSSHLSMNAQNKNIYLTQEAHFPEPLKWIIFFRAYPALYLNWTINGEPRVIYKIESNQINHNKSMIKRKDQYEIKVNWFDGEITLIIHNPTIKDTGTYILSAEVPDKSNNLKQNITLKFFKKGVPQVVNSVIKPLTKAKLHGTKFTIECSAFGFPFPELKVYFKPCSSTRNCHTQAFGEISHKDILYNDETKDAIDSNSEITGKRSFRWKGRAKVQGYYLCNAKNDYGSQNSTEKLLIISDSGFSDSDFLQIEVKRNEDSFVPSSGVSLIEGDDVTFTCRGNTFMTSHPLIWTVMKGENSSFLFGNKNFSTHKVNVSVYEKQTELSYISQMVSKASKEMDGMIIKCTDGSITSFEKTINVTVIDARPPQWIGETLMKRHLILSENEKLDLSCVASGTPSPSVTWYKDDNKLELDENDRRISLLNGNLSFEFLFSEDSGKYLCKVLNREGSIEDYVTLEVKDPDAVPQKILISSIAVFAAISLIVVIILLIKVYKDKKAERSFKLEIQKRFIEGNPESLNPDLDLGEQADLLPYDNKFEFPRDRVTIENLLGSGAFGNVFKATATDLISGVSKTTVAVKMLKSPTNPALMKTLVSELKIMIHIGRHINIVNLLGACSKNMASKGELLLLVEYCRYGNILEYMRRQRTEFLNQININDKIDPSSKYFRRRTSSISRNSLRTTYAQLDLQRNSNYFCNNPEASNDSEHSRRSFMESGAMTGTAERRRIKSDSAPNDTITNTDMTTDTIGNTEDNYISESVFEHRGPLCSEDLLHWSYQIANGMFYLSEKKVIHGDLAARNILLADKNVVKISDFGLSKNIYKQDNYKKKSECPLPVKWLALEALRDSIFSTHSDVWSYGVVLWEIFSLGSNPYAGVEVDAEFVNKLEKGLRLSHPQYATAELYQIMTRCWSKNPNDRPSFRKLEKILGDMLGEAEKQMYITLNAHYEENNYISEHLKNLKTPSYDSRVRSFFTEKDEDGYEKALPSPNISIMPENEIMYGSPQKFQLHPVPKKKNLARQGTKEEMEVLLDSVPYSEYLIMNSPTDKEKPIEMETFSSRRTPQIYANLVHLNKSNISDAQRKSLESVESPIDVSNSFDPKEDRVFTFNEINSMETDSVFESGLIEDTYCKNDLRRLNNNGYYNGKNNISSYNYKHDSGIYSPNLIQNNPIYLHKNNAIHENENDAKIISSDSSFKPSNCIGKKQRNQSDSSSGIGSLDDRHNSLEKQRNEMEKLQNKDSVLKIQTPLQQIA